MGKRFFLAAIAAAGTAVLAGCGGSSAAPKSTAQTTESAGQEVYEQECSACHGSNLKGGLQIGSATSADIRWSTLQSAYTAPLLQRAILHGLDESGQPLDAAMPRWQGKLTSRQVSEVIAYLKTK